MDLFWHIYGGTCAATIAVGDGHSSRVLCSRVDCRHRIEAGWRMDRRLMSHQLVSEDGRLRLFLIHLGRNSIIVLHHGSDSVGLCQTKPFQGEDVGDWES